MSGGVPVSGRTSWWAHDAAWHRRGRQMRLAAKFGPAGPWVLCVITSLAQEQRSRENDNGEVHHDVFALGRECFIDDESEVRAIVAFAGEIGALDGLRWSHDGERFTARVSGWAAEQARAENTVKKRRQRAEKTSGDKRGQTGTNSEMSPFVPLPDQTRPDHRSVCLSERADADAIDDLVAQVVAAAESGRMAWTSNLTQRGEYEAGMREHLRSVPLDVAKQAATDFAAKSAGGDRRLGGNPVSALGGFVKRAADGHKAGSPHHETADQARQRRNRERAQRAAGLMQDGVLMSPTTIEGGAQ